VLVPAKTHQCNPHFWVKDQVRKVLHSRGLVANIRLGWKFLTGTSPVGYMSEASALKKKQSYSTDTWPSGSCCCKRCRRSSCSRGCNGCGCSGPADVWTSCHTYKFKRWRELDRSFWKLWSNRETARQCCVIVFPTFSFRTVDKAPMHPLTEREREREREKRF